MLSPDYLWMEGTYHQHTHYPPKAGLNTQQCIEKPLSAAAFLGSDYWDKDLSIGVFNLRVSHLKPDILKIIYFGAI